jgi:pimeloyl-ACP methyl ester carboxylesterase
MNTSIPRDERIITAGDATLRGFLQLPDNASGIVVFVHGSGSSRFSRRNNAVASFLRDAPLGTFLFDLLTEDEERIDVLTREYRFDIPLLCRRLEGAIEWLIEQPEAGGLPIGLFGSSTGAAAALIVAARFPNKIAAVVSRGGRVDLARDYLDKVRAPTLFIVGGADFEVLRLNRSSLEMMQSICKLAVVDGATHLFEEPGALEQVSDLTRAWFLQQMRQDIENTGT